MFSPRVFLADLLRVVVWHLDPPETSDLTESLPR